MGATDRGGQFVHANGIDIHYIETGSGPPLVLLHGALVSTGPAWAGTPISYYDHMATLGRHFRVIAPDTRGSGATVHKEGTASLSLLAQDVVALIEALGLDRPLIGGFSEGGITATIVGITRPDAVRAIVNDAGYDVFNPDAPIFEMGRVMFGGSPDATQGDPDAFARNFGAAEEMRPVLELLRADYDGAQGEGSWRRYIEDAFVRFSRPPGYTFDDLRAVTAPTLVVVGDRDDFCSVEEGVTAYRRLARGELAVVPNTGHVITPAKIAAYVEFLECHAG